MPLPFFHKKMLINLNLSQPVICFWFWSTGFSITCIKLQLTVTTSVPQSLPKSFKNYIPVPKLPYTLVSFKNFMGLPAVFLASSLIKTFIRSGARTEPWGTLNILGDMLETHLGCWINNHILSTRTCLFSLVSSVQLHGKLIFRRHDYGFCKGREAALGPFGDSYSGDQPERNRSCFFPLTQIYSMSESNEMPKLQGLCSHSGFWLWLRGPDSLTRAGFGNCPVISSVNCAKPC